MKAVSILSFTLLCCLSLQAQFAPPAGQFGSTAIHQSSALFINWAKSGELQRSWVHIADTSLGLATLGELDLAFGPADNQIVSLGDGGQISLAFDPPIRNGEGFDFAIFENGFSDTFLELAFVEVSSDGQHFVRFPAISNSPTAEQIGPFGSVDARLINNLAGKYRVEYGTPFDLEELKDSMDININHISHVRLIDVVGTIEMPYAQVDAEGQLINDPWPTPFESCGFDLDAIGVIHQLGSVANQEIEMDEFQIKLYPNPSSPNETVQVDLTNLQNGQWQLLTMQGQVLAHGKLNKRKKLSLKAPNRGSYILRLISDKGNFTQKCLVR